VEVLRSHIQPLIEISARHSFAPARAVNDAKSVRTSLETVFETKTMWSYGSSGLPAPKPK
jgi:hypothetical protein